jgi:hypothetical protein
MVNVLNAEGEDWVKSGRGRSKRGRYMIYTSPQHHLVGQRLVIGMDRSLILAWHHAQGIKTRNFLCCHTTTYQCQL